MRPEKKAVELTDEEKIILSILKPEGKMELGALKTQAALSGKKWDKSLKGLSKHGLTKVNKTDDGLFVEMV